METVQKLPRVSLICTSQEHTLVVKQEKSSALLVHPAVADSRCGQTNSALSQPHAAYTAMSSHKWEKSPLLNGCSGRSRRRGDEEEEENGGRGKRDEQSPRSVYLQCCCCFCSKLTRMETHTQWVKRKDAHTHFSSSKARYSSVDPL